MKVLLIDPSPERAEMLTAALEPRDELLQAPDGFYALTMIEREQPDLVVVSGQPGGLSASEVAAIIHDDPSQGSVRLGLLVTAEERTRESEESEESDFDLVLDADLPGPALARQIRRFLANPGSKWQVVRPPEPKPGEDAAEEATPQTLSGSFSVLSLPDLIQALCEARSSGRLVLEWDDAEASILLEDGRILDAAWEERRGRIAFREILRRGASERDGGFRFEPMSPRELFSLPRRIDRTARELLLTASIDLDEGSRWRQGA